jgi:hypothetical protein
MTRPRQRIFTADNELRANSTSSVSFPSSHAKNFLSESSSSRRRVKCGSPNVSTYSMHPLDNASRNDCPVEFYGIATVESRKDYPEDLLQVMVDHKSESFLPQDVIAIARCVQNSLVCLSLRPEDRGSVYYWDWYWRYPWCKAFFEERIERVTRNYTNPELILRDENDPLHSKLCDQLNFATLTRLAPSFTEWSALCEDQRNNPAD